MKRFKKGEKVRVTADGLADYPFDKVRGLIGIILVDDHSPRIPYKVEFPDLKDLWWYAAADLESAEPKPNYRLIALRMSKARTIGEAREIYKRGAK